VSTTHWRLWWQAILYASVSLALLVFAFLPFHRQAHTESERADRLSRELVARLAVIEQLPNQQAELEQLDSELSHFRASLAGTHEVDQLMAHLMERARASGLEMWILNPSVPDLIKLEAGGDSLSRLDAAVLPVSFECRGGFLQVARFLESEERRADFYRWSALTVTGGPQAGAVQAKGEFKLLLLPQAAPEASL
jgi:hypothetical protein